MRNVVSGLIDLFSSHASLQHTLDIVFSFRHMDCSRAINQVDSFGQGHILPNLSLSWNWSCLADSFLEERVDHTRLSDIRIANETDADVLLVSVEDVELPEEIDERPFTERVGNAGSVGNGGIELTEILHPFCDDPNGHEVSLVDQENQVLMREIFLEMLFKSQRACPHWIS